MQGREGHRTVSSGRPGPVQERLSRAGPATMTAGAPFAASAAVLQPSAVRSERCNCSGLAPSIVGALALRLGAASQPCYNPAHTTAAPRLHDNRVSRETMNSVDSPKNADPPDAGHQPSSPPVIDYEGSDYEERFWGRGERAYEDQAERIALRKLLPPAGRRLVRRADVPCRT